MSDGFWMALFSCTASVFAAILAYLARQKAGRVGQQVQEVHQVINSRLDELVSAKEKVAHQAGMSQERADASALASQTAVITTDHLGVVLVWSTNATSLFGWKHTEAVGRNLTDLIIPAAYQELHIKAMEACHAAGRMPREQPLIFRCRDKAGEEFFCDVLLTGELTGGEWIYTGTLRRRAERFD